MRGLQVSFPAQGEAFELALKHRQAAIKHDSSTAAGPTREKVLATEGDGEAAHASISQNRT